MTRITVFLTAGNSGLHVNGSGSAVTGVTAHGRPGLIGFTDMDVSQTGSLVTVGTVHVSGIAQHIPGGERVINRTVAAGVAGITLGVACSDGSSHSRI